MTDEEHKEEQRRFGRLRNAEIFSALEDAELRVISENSEYHHYDAEAPIFQTGDSGAAVYIVDSGEVVVRKRGEDDREIDIARYLPGDSFGELDMLSHSLRTASAYCLSETVLLKFPMNGSSFYEKILESHPDISARIVHEFLVVIAGRIRKANASIKENSPLVQELRKQIYSDKLTGLLNRTYLEENLGRYMADPKRPASLLMIKPDNFKVINDTYGHEIGDRALYTMASHLASYAGADEVVVRYMGNELALLLPGRGASEAYDAALEIHRLLTNLDLSELTGTAEFRLSVSIGIAVYPEHATDKHELIEEAHALPLIGRARGGNKILFPKDRKEHES